MTSTARRWVAVAALAALYFAAAKLGLSMAEVAEQVTLVWPPTGIALAAVVLLGYRVWPGIALGAFAANVTASEPIVTALGIAGGNTAEALAGAWLLQRIGFDSSLSRLKDVAGLIVLAAIGATAISATIGTTSLCLGGVQPWARYGSIWLVWWLGDTTGAIVGAAFLLAWSDFRRIPIGRRYLVESIVVFVVGCALFTAVYGPKDAVRFPFVYLAFPFLIWAGLRFGQRGTTAVSLIMSVAGIWATLNEWGPFVAGPTPQRLLHLQIFLGVYAVTGLIVGASMDTRQRAEDRLRADYRVGQVLANSDSLGRAAPQILRSVGETLGWDVGSIWSVDRQAGVLRCLEVWHGQDRSVPRFEAATRERTFLPGIGLPGRVWSNARPAWIADVVRDDNFPRGPIAAQAGLHGAFGFPLRSGSDVVGVMEFFSHRIRQPDQELLDMVGSIGAQIGQFVERKHAETAQRAAEAELREADRRKDQFLATLAHELRNPLAPLSNAFHLLQSGDPDPRTRAEALALGQRQIDAMVRLVDDLLDVSRITRGKFQLRLESVELADIVRRAVETARPLIVQRGQDLAVQLPGDPVTLEVDPTRIAQVLSNLLNNAAKYSERGGRIRLAAELRGDAERPEIVLRVSDTGIGIPREMLPLVFDAFMQGDHSFERTHGGLGIGLTLVRSVIEMHGGSVEARSGGVGQGSEFVVRLPLRPRGTGSPSGAPRSPAPTGEGRPALRVLVVDDNEDSVKSMALLLEAMGHEVRVAHDGLEAVEAAAAFRPDIALLDIGMPRLNGYDAARRIREQHAGDPLTLIALTGWGKEEDRRRSKEAGFDHHLVKPVDPTVLGDLLARCAQEGGA